MAISGKRDKKGEKERKRDQRRQKGREREKKIARRRKKVIVISRNEREKETKLTKYQRNGYILLHPKMAVSEWGPRNDLFDPQNGPKPIPLYFTLFQKMQKDEKQQKHVKRDIWLFRTCVRLPFPHNTWNTCFHCFRDFREKGQKGPKRGHFRPPKSEVTKMPPNLWI